MMLPGSTIDGVVMFVLLLVAMRPWASESDNISLGNIKKQTMCEMVCGACCKDPCHHSHT